MKKITIQQVISSLRYKDAASPTVEEIEKRKRFLSKFPDQEANVLSYQTNPACKCSRDLAAAIQSNAEDKNILLSYIMGEQIILHTPVNLVGKIMTIDDTEAEWTKLVMRLHADSAMFRNMSIVPGLDDSGKKTLRVFFY